MATPSSAVLRKFDIGAGHCGDNVSAAAISIFSRLADELVEAIGNSVDSLGDLSAFSRAERRLHRQLGPLLYSRSAREDESSALRWAVAGPDREQTAQKAVDAGANVAPIIDRDGGPLVSAAKGGYTGAVKVLLGAKCIRPGQQDQDSRDALFWASRKGHSSVVRLLLDLEGLDFDRQDSFGTTAFSAAASNGRVDVMRLLLQTNRINPDSKDAQGRTPLSIAAAANKVEAVNLLLETEGVDPDSVDRENEESPLARALFCPEIVRVLLQSGRVDVNKRRRDSRSILSIAAHLGCREAVEALLKAPGIDIHSRDTQGRTPLIWAATGSDEAILKQLLAHEGILVNEKDDDGASVLALAAASAKTTTSMIRALLDMNGIEVDSRDGVGRTPLMQAVAGAGTDETIRLLLERGADPNVEDSEGWTPLTRAANGDRFSKAEILLKGGANPDTVVSHGHGWPALCLVVTWGFTTLAEFLMDHGADINVSTSAGWTPLILAAHHGHMDLVVSLVKRGADVHLSGADTVTPLVSAAGKGHLKVAMYLLDHGADIDAFTANGFSNPLIDAAQLHKLEMVKMLLARGADQSQRDLSGGTAFRLAATRGYIDIMEVLHDAPGGADMINDVNYLDSTIMAHASLCGETQAVQKLLDWGASSEKVDRYGSLPVFAAVRNGHHDTAQLLLSNSSLSLDTRDSLGHTLIYWAERSDSNQMVDVLRSHANRIGAAFPEEELAAVQALDFPVLPFDPNGCWCDVCLRVILPGSESYACPQCFNNTWLACAECKAAGAKCLDETHEWGPHRCAKHTRT